MIYNKVLNWIRDTLVGIGCSLLAAGFFGIVTVGTHPQAIAICLVVGSVLIVGGLVVSFFYEDQ